MTEIHSWQSCLLRGIQPMHFSQKVSKNHLNDETKILTKSETFFRDQIFRNQNQDQNFLKLRLFSFIISQMGAQAGLRYDLFHSKHSNVKLIVHLHLHIYREIEIILNTMERLPTNI